LLHKCNVRSQRNGQIWKNKKNARKEEIGSLKKSKNLEKKQGGNMMDLNSKADTSLKYFTKVTCLTMGAKKQKMTAIV
jgi:hypothetical protein